MVIIPIALWYYFSFLIHLSGLNDIVQQGTSIVSSAHPNLYAIAIADGSKESIRVHAIREAYEQLACKGRTNGKLSWHLNNALWYYVSYLHFSEPQIFAIWAYYAPYEEGYGLQKASLHYFNKPLSVLDNRGLAALVIVGRDVQRYRPGSDKSEQRINQVLEKMKAIKTGSQRTVKTGF